MNYQDIEFAWLEWNILPSGDLGWTLANAEEAKSSVIKIVHLNAIAIFSMR
jgi:N-acetyl-beta-hexosaminidase